MVDFAWRRRSGRGEVKFCYFIRVFVWGLFRDYSCCFGLDKIVQLIDL